MDVLPKEMLLEIFQFLSARDLISLSEVCTSFCTLISSTERLLNKIPCHFFVDIDKLILREFIQRQSVEPDVKNFISETLTNGTRKYSRIVIGDMDGDQSVEILQKWNASVKQLTFRRGYYGLKHICKMLVACPNVKRLKFCRGSLRGDIDVTGMELPRLNLVLLQLENVGSQIFSILRESRVSLKKLEGLKLIENLIDFEFLNLKFLVDFKL